MRIKFFLFISLFFYALGAGAQNRTLTLKECIEMGVEQNLMLKTKQEDVHTSEVAYSENRNKLLPAIQAFGSITSNLHRGTSVSQIAGTDTYTYVQGLKNMAQGGIQLNMPLYDQTLYIGLKIADKMKEISSAEFDKAREDLIVQIAQIYYLAQTTNEQILLIEKNISSLESLDAITASLRENGLVLEVDAKRVKLNLSDLRVQRDNAMSAFEQQLNMLRFILDLSPEEQFNIEPINTELTDRSWDQHIDESLPELRSLELSLQMNEQQCRQIKASYIPTLSLVVSTAWTNPTDKLGNYFRKNNAEHRNNWYNNTAIGLQLSIPIYDKSVRRNKIRRIDIQHNKLSYAQEAKRKELETKYSNALNEWYNTRRNVQIRKDNYLLSRDVYDITANQYREGVASMTTLLQDEMSLSASSTAYVAAIYNYLVSELTLLKLTGNLEQLTK